MAPITLLHLQVQGSVEGPLQSFSTGCGKPINFWPATGELEVKGHPQAGRNLGARLEQAITGQGR